MPAAWSCTVEPLFVPVTAGVTAPVQIQPWCTPCHGCCEGVFACLQLQNLTATCAVTASVQVLCIALTASVQVMCVAVTHECKSISAFGLLQFFVCSCARLSPNLCVSVTAVLQTFGPWQAHESSHTC